MRTERAILPACVLLLLGACAPEEAKAPNPTRSLDERRAVEVIRRAIKSEGADPAPGRDEPLAGTSNKMLHIDVGVQGHAYGVAYISSEDAQALGNALPAPNKKDESLKLVRTGTDGETFVVLLFQKNYVYDDLTGSAHEQTTIAAESALARDAEDFITRAHSKKYK